MNKKIYEGIFSVLLLLPLLSFSQEGSESKISAGADFFSSYVWRGTKYGTGPAIQPTLKYTGDRLSAGAWGSFDFLGYQEADLFVSFTPVSWLSLGITDYYYPGLPYNDFSVASGSHAYEINAVLSGRKLSLSANFVINEAGMAGSYGGDKYIQLEYNFGSLNIFMGAGDGWHTADPETGENKFALCNLGLGISRTISINEYFSVPVSGQLIFNPDRNQMFMVMGFSLFQ